MKKSMHPLGAVRPTHMIQHGHGDCKSAMGPSGAAGKGPSKAIKAPPQLPAALAPAPQDSQNPGVFKA